MSEAVELKLYSPLQIDNIDRDAPDRAVPSQAVGRDCRSEYTRIIMNAFRAIQAQEDARNAFTAMKQNYDLVELSLPAVLQHTVESGPRVPYLAVRNFRIRICVRQGPVLMSEDFFLAESALRFVAAAPAVYGGA